MIIELALGLCFGMLLAVRLISLVIRANKEESCIIGTLIPMRHHKP